MYLHFLSYLNTWDGTSYIYVQELNMAIIVPTDALAPYNARPSAGTMLTLKLEIVFLKFLWPLNV